MDPIGLQPEVKELIGKTLHSKFKRIGTIDDDFVVAQSLLKSTTDGFNLLLQLLLIVHPNFVQVRKRVQDIPKYSAYDDLYTFANAITEFEKLQQLSHRLYSDLEMTTMYLEHIDNKRYEDAVESSSK